MNSATPPHDGSNPNLALLDDALAPLKRNHACLQCKKRKVKCDATKPACSPCLRSHAHAIRSANRNRTAPPPCVCTYTETDAQSPERTPPREETAKRKRAEGGVPVAGLAGAGAVSAGQGQGKDAEKDALLARIADLERQLAGLTPSSDADNSLHDPGKRDINQQHMFGYPPAQPISDFYPRNAVPLPEPILSEAELAFDQQDEGLGLGADLGLDDLFMVPNNWPKGLPSPFLLEHLIETFFNYVPVTSRMLHRANLLARIKLPPTSPDFPFAGLLHAICATASNHTAWVNNLAPHQVEAAVSKHFMEHLDFLNIDDFGLAQAERAHKAVDLVTTVCVMGSGSLVLQVVQTCVILSEVYFAKGFPLRGWMMGGQPARLIAVLEVSGRQPRQSIKEPFLQPPVSDFEREERLTTLWMAFMIDAGFALNSNWIPSMNLADITSDLPGSTTDWQRMMSIASNSQGPDSPDLYHHHPIDDSFLLAVKASILMSRAASWIRKWQQRIMEPGDEMSGPQDDAFITLHNDIQTFKHTVPSALKSVHRIADASSHTDFDANLLSIHLFPNIALCLMHEAFDRSDPPNASHRTTRKACEAIMGVLHLIPSNLDVTLVFTPLTLFCLYTAGRMISEIINTCLKAGEYEQSARWRSDLVTLQNLLDRYGQRHSLGASLRMFLENYIRLASQGNRPTRAETCSSFHPDYKRITLTADPTFRTKLPTGDGTQYPIDYDPFANPNTSTMSVEDMILGTNLSTSTSIGDAGFGIGLGSGLQEIDMDLWKSFQNDVGALSASASASASACGSTGNTPSSTSYPKSQSNTCGVASGSGIGSGSGGTSYTSPDSDVSTRSHSSRSQSKSQQPSSTDTIPLSGTGAPDMLPGLGMGHGLGSVSGSASASAQLPTADPGPGPGQDQSLPWPALVEIGQLSFFSDDIPANDNASNTKEIPKSTASMLEELQMQQHRPQGNNTLNHSGMYGGDLLGTGIPFGEQQQQQQQPLVPQNAQSGHGQWVYGKLVPDDHPRFM